MAKSLGVPIIDPVVGDDRKAAGRWDLWFRKVDKVLASGSLGASNLILTVPGTLGTDTDVATPYTTATDIFPYRFDVYVKEAPVDGTITVSFYADGDPVATAVIAPDAFSGTVDISGVTISAGTSITLDVAISGGATFPGRDLSAIVRY